MTQYSGPSFQRDADEKAAAAKQAADEKKIADAKAKKDADAKAEAKDAKAEAKADEKDAKAEEKAEKKATKHPAKALEALIEDIEAADADGTLPDEDRDAMQQLWKRLSRAIARSGA